MTTESLFFSTSEKFEIVSFDKRDSILSIKIKSIQPTSCCPNCHVSTSKVHSYYFRKIKDLPAFENGVIITLQARKFYCCHPECILKVFTERFEKHFSPYRRGTYRLERLFLSAVLESSAKSAERLIRKMGVFVSDTTLLRIVDREPLPATYAPKILGVDDWAWKKRDKYGTVLVDLTNRKIIDLLIDREASTLEKWLKNNPGVVIISRDRYGKYIQGATSGAPDALQVADRWHLLKNLGEAIRKQLDREYSVLKELRDEVIAENKYNNKSKKGIKYQTVKNNPLDRYRERFREVKQLYSDGQSILSIAKRFKMSRQTVKKYIAIHSLPKKSSYNQLDKHMVYIKERLLQEPSLQLRDLWYELQQQGYNGAYTTLSENLKKAGVMMGKKSKIVQFPRLSDLLWTPSKASILFFKDVDALSNKQKNTLISLCEKSHTLTKALHLVRYFRFLMKTKAGNRLNEWISQAIDSGLKEIGGFAQSMKPDFQAIQNAFNLPWSNGPVEGNVNKIKTLKRQMYGRGGFQLLKRRLLLNSE